MKVICGDAIEYLMKHKAKGSIITSIPDMSEVEMDEKKYEYWFTDAVASCMMRLGEGCPVIFYQTDRKSGGKIFSKAFVIMKLASSNGLDLMWHKIVVRHGMNKVDLMRPGFTHYMAFGRSREGCRPGKATPDVIEFTKALYDNGTDLKVANHAVVYASKFTSTIIDPFCGKGTIPIIADKLGLKAIGIDIDPKQCDSCVKLSKSGFPYKPVSKVAWGRPTKPFMPPDS